MRVGKREWLGVLAAGLLMAGLLLPAATPAQNVLSGTKPEKAQGLRPIPETLDFGRVDPYTANTRTVEIHNDGPSPVTLSGVKSSCKCTLAALRQYSVPPGGSVPLEISLELRDYDADSVHTQVAVVPADPKIPVKTLNVSAEIIPEITIEPSELDLGKVKQGRDASLELRVRRTGKPEANLVRVETPPEWTSSLKALEPGLYAVHVALKPDASLGMHAGRLALITDVKRRPRVEIPLRAETVGIECAITPKVLVFGPAAPGAPAGAIELRNPEPLSLTEVRCPPRTFAWRSEILEGGRRIRLNLTLAPDAPPGNLTGKIALLLKEGEQVETREVPFFGSVQPPPTAP